MKKKNNILKKLSYKDFVPLISGLIGKIALVSSFAMVWAKELSISNPNFVLENVRIEILLGSIITLIAAILFSDAVPAGTLAPLLVLVPAMTAFGVHPFILAITVGIIGFIAVRTGVFKKLVNLAGFITKNSITLTFGISGIWMSTMKMYSYFHVEKSIFFILFASLTLFYVLLLYFKKKWLVIPVVSVIALAVPSIFGLGFQLVPVELNLSFSPFYWWNDMWGIGFGLNLITILKTLPFAFFVILLWTIDTVSIETIREASYEVYEEKEDMDIDKSFLIISVRNIIGAIFGGSQTASMWRSFLIPLYIVKRPMKTCAILLGISGILVGITVLPIQIMSYIPLVWSVLLFGIFMPFTLTAMTNIIGEKKNKTRILIVAFTLVGLVLSPILTWILSIISERFDKHKSDNCL